MVVCAFVVDYLLVVCLLCCVVWFAVAVWLRTRCVVFGLCLVMVCVFLCMGHLLRWVGFGWFG